MRTSDLTGAMRIFAEDILGISSEVVLTIDAVKTAYRSKAKELHTDMSNGSHEKFIELKNAYDYLMDDFKTGYINEPNAYTLNRTTVQGDLLTELGKGFPDKSAVECKRCDSQGYTREEVMEWGDCPTCNGRGFICPDCGNTGKFILRSGRIVDCRRCANPESAVTYSWRYSCRSCWGTGQGYAVGNKVVYHTCHSCQGHGFIECFNPVLQKLAILRGTLK